MWLQYCHLTQNKIDARTQKNSPIFICNVKIENYEIMISFDVTSLYTNVPIKDTINIIKDLIEHDQEFSNKTKIPTSEFLDLVTLVLTKTWFLFNGKYLSQTDGVAMGGPASSVVAEIYMQSHESTALTTTDTPPKVWKRFVDDVYAIIH